MKLQRRCDASLDAREGAKPHAGARATLGGGGVAFKSKAAPKSTAEAELSALSDAASSLTRDREFAIGSAGRCLCFLKKP